MNVKRVYRLYREEGLAVRRRKRKRVAVARVPQAAPTRINEGWGMDFMSDVLVGGRRYRIFNVVEALSREGLASEVDTSLPALAGAQAAAAPVVAVELLAAGSPGFRAGERGESSSGGVRGRLPRGAVMAPLAGWRLPAVSPRRIR